MPHLYVRAVRGIWVRGRLIEQQWCLQVDQVWPYAAYPLCQSLHREFYFFQGETTFMVSILTVEVGQYCDVS